MTTISVHRPTISGLCSGMSAWSWGSRSGDLRPVDNSEVGDMLRRAMADLLVSSSNATGARLPDGRWVRVHQEDMCQATGTPQFSKYESHRGPGAREVADLVANVSSNAEEDTRRFVHALIFTWLICGTDAHARNYSVVLRGGNARLAPLYDVNSHLAYTDGGFQRSVDGVDGIFRASLLTRRRWVDEAMHLHVDPDWMVTEIDRQMVRLIDSMHAAADGDCVSRYGSSVVTRLIGVIHLWNGLPVVCRAGSNQQPRERRGRQRGQQDECLGTSVNRRHSGVGRTLLDWVPTQQS